MERGQERKGLTTKFPSPFPSVCFFRRSGLTLTRWSDLRSAAAGHLSRPLYKSWIRREREHANRQQSETKKGRRESSCPHRVTTAPGK